MITAAGCWLLAAGKIDLERVLEYDDNNLHLHIRQVRNSKPRVPSRVDVTRVLCDQVINGTANGWGYRYMYTDLYIYTHTLDS